MYAVIVGQTIFHGFRCPTHQLAASPRYSTWVEMRAARKEHRRRNSAK